MSIQVVHLDVFELVVVIRLKSTVHADIEQTVAVLQNAVHVVAGHTDIGRLFLDDLELIAVILVQAIAGGYPDKSVTVLIDLTGETTRQLFVSIKQLAYLGMRAQGE